jgi:ribosomal protein L6P/L9E
MQNYKGIYIKKPPFVGYLETAYYYYFLTTAGKPCVEKFATNYSILSSIRQKIHYLSRTLNVTFQIIVLKGIGFRAYYYKKNHIVYFNLGYNHLCSYKLPFNVFVKVRKQHVIIYSVSIRDLRHVSWELKNLRIPDPYKGKGIQFRDENLKIKKGKQR